MFKVTRVASVNGNVAMSPNLNHFSELFLSPTHMASGESNVAMPKPFLLNKMLDSRVGTSLLQLRGALSCWISWGLWAPYRPPTPRTSSGSSRYAFDIKHKIIYFLVLRFLYDSIQGIPSCNFYPISLEWIISATPFLFASLDTDVTYFEFLVVSVVGLVLTWLPSSDWPEPHTTICDPLGVLKYHSVWI